MFTDFTLSGGRISLGLKVNLLIDTLNVLASSESPELVLRYPGTNGELFLE
jgi:hypothetical protein